MAIRDNLESLLEDERAITAGWFDGGRTLIVLGVIFAVVGFMVEPLYACIHTANSTLYTAQNLQDFDGFYHMLKWFPLVGLGMIAYYIINYSNVGGGNQ